MCLYIYRKFYVRVYIFTYITRFCHIYILKLHIVLTLLSSKKKKEDENENLHIKCILIHSWVRVKWDKRKLCIKTCAQEKQLGYKLAKYNICIYSCIKYYIRPKKYKMNIYRYTTISLLIFLYHTRSYKIQMGLQDEIWIFCSSICAGVWRGIVSYIKLYTYTQAKYS